MTTQYKHIRLIESKGNTSMETLEITMGIQNGFTNETHGNETR